ncbi:MULTISPECIES: SWIM zinc finger family protein [unclassified Halomonas]|uniref:SWIM zinc finger family protein n=1 Tax=unclassified Halomonas TaxID=2609666 RepID=UPI002883C770|nr:MULTISPECIES: SWIM zinc finger family protein [unclassified Halomonas]MDT0499507.1 SWIM zinc finger family protein [Halomonas sp. PAR7]MDT0510676.1 SWIM zinc finger family protein [Halomonas sp. LES1]MDT0592311.1 SWIM zinc finger family protein [Halomonas sp. PAR8]
MQSFARGQDYAQQGKVRKHPRIEHEDAMLVLRAQVDGSGRSRYLTSLAVDPDNPEMGVVSDCSCPVGRQCKHAVAVIQSFVDAMEAEGIPPEDDTAMLEQRWEAWLDELQSPLGGKRYVEELEEDHRLALFLDIDPNSRTPTLQVSPVWVRPTKRRARGNGWVKPRPINVRRGGGLTPRPPQGLAPDQEEALELLMLGEQGRQLSGTGYEYAWSSVTHAFQARALWSLLATGTGIGVTPVGALARQDRSEARVMNPHATIISPGDHASPLSVVGVDVTVLISKDQASGREITLQRGDEGVGLPPHSHPWDESFSVLKGAVHFSAGDQSALCDAGTLAHVPAGTVNAFHFAQGGGEMIEITQQGQAVEMFRTVNARVLPGSPDLPTLLEILNQHGVTVHGPEEA